MRGSGASELENFHNYIHLYTDAISMQLPFIYNGTNFRVNALFRYECAHFVYSP